MPPAKVACRSDFVTRHRRILPAFGRWAGANVKPWKEGFHHTFKFSELTPPTSSSCSSLFASQHAEKKLKGPSSQSKLDFSHSSSKQREKGSKETDNERETALVEATGMRQRKQSLHVLISCLVSVLFNSRDWMGRWEKSESLLLLWS